MSGQQPQQPHQGHQPYGQQPYQGHQPPPQHNPQFQGQPYPAQQGGYPPAPGGDQRAAAILAHLSAPIAFVVSAGWLSFVGPLIVWAIYKDKAPAVRQAAAGAFNFNLSAWALTILGWILLFTVIGLPIALLIWAVVFIVSAICHIIGAVRAASGQRYDYPFQIPVLR